MLSEKRNKNSYRCD